MLIIYALLFCMLPTMELQEVFVVIKQNGDQIMLKNLKIVQGEDVVSDQALIFSSNGKKMSQPLSDLRRLNLKDDVQKKKGVVTWNALLIKSNDKKLEIQIEIARITGINESGNLVEIPGGSIDKIIF